MLTKTRATIIALVASAGFASATLAPAASYGQKNESGNHAATCEVYRLTYELWDEAQQSAFENGEHDLAQYYAEQETAAKEAASEAGCSWPGALSPALVKLPVIVIKPVALKPALAQG